MTTLRLEVGSERNLHHTLALSRAHSRFTNFKKVIAATIILFMTLIAGVVSITTFDMHKANAITVDPISDFLCTNVTNGTAYLGGISQPIIDNFKNTQGDPPWEGVFGVFSVPMKDRTNVTEGKPVEHEWTAVERYGYFATEYTNWIGMQTHYPLERILDEIFSDGKIAYMGTGGKPGAFGQYVKILEGSQSPFFSQGMPDCVPVASHLNIVAANLIQGLNQALTGTAINFYIISSSMSLSDEDSIMRPLGEVIETLIAGDPDKGIKGMKDLLFLDFMFPLIMIGALVIGFGYARNGRALEAFQRIAWILGVSILGMLLLSHPMAISGTVEKVVNSVTSAFSEGILKVDDQYPQCSLGESEKNFQRTERELGCYIWMQNVYRPWVEAQFGMPYEQAIKLNKDPNVVEGFTEAGDPTDADTYSGLNASNWEGINAASVLNKRVDEDGNLINPAFMSALISLGYDLEAFYPNYDSMFNNGKPVGGEERADNTRGVFENFNPHLGKKPVDDSVKNWPFYQMATSSTWPTTTGYNHSEIAFNQLALSDNVEWKNPSAATMNSFMALLSSALPNIAMILISGTLISLQLTLSILIIVAPFIFVIALIPSFGRDVLTKWVNLITSVTVRRIVISFFFMFYLRLYFVIMGAVMTPILKVLFLGLISFVILKFKDEIAHFIMKALQIRGRNTDMSNVETGALSKAQSTVNKGVNKVRQSRIRTSSNAQHKKAAQRRAKATKANQQPSQGQQGNGP